MYALNHAEVARLAYRLWEERGRPFRSPEVDWCRAERELWARSEAAYPISSFALGPQTGPWRQADVWDAVS
jgi:DUF2934 family protein